MSHTMAGRVPDAQEDEPIVFFGQLDRLIVPHLPSDWVIGMTPDLASTISIGSDTKPPVPAGV